MQRIVIYKNMKNVADPIIEEYFVNFIEAYLRDK